MGRIVQLPEEVFSKIAAGEVIERPANAVKELIENSLDAYSKNIKIRILDSGLKLIEVRDDGIGIYPDDLPLTINRYATSKIKSEKDLLKINTFGFRGEALYAISKVSNIYITSKSIESDKTYTLYASEGNIISIKEEHINYFNNGTIIKVVDLFFNSPVRKNFISSNKVENYNTINIVKQLACINYKVAFSLYIDDKLILNYLPTDTIINRVKEVFKNPYLEDFSLKIEDYEITLVLSNVFKENVKNKKGSNKGNIYFYVNNRIVGDSNYSLVKLVKNVFDETLDDRYYIEGIVSLNLPPDEVDVNIHPRKFDVRFLKPIFVKNLIQKAVKEFINTKIKTTITFLDKIEEKIDKNLPNQWYNDLKNDNLKNNLKNQEPNVINTDDNKNLSSFVSNLIKKIEKIQQKEDTQKNKSIKDNYLQNSKEQTKLIKTEREKKLEILETIEKADKIEEKIDLKDSKDIKLLYYWDETYFMFYYNKAFYIVDQHNAHEKIIYTSLLNKINLHSQILLIPIEIFFDEMDLNKVEFLINSTDTVKYIINELSFDTEITKNSIIIKTYPYVFNNNYVNLKFDIKLVFLDLLDLITGISLFDKDKILRDIISMFACKSAVKAGTKLNESEIIYLCENILKLDSLNPNFCPHGRNAVIKIDFKYIDKLFER